MSKSKNTIPVRNLRAGIFLPIAEITTFYTIFDKYDKLFIIKSVTI